MQDWLIDRLGLEPGDPRWWNARKVEGVWYVVRQQLLLHPAFGLLTIAPFAVWPKWYTAWGCALVLMVLHEITQFKTMPGPETLNKAICERDRHLLDGAPLWLRNAKANGRHVNACDRLLDVCLGGTVAGWAVYGVWVLAQHWKG